MPGISVARSGGIGGQSLPARLLLEQFPVAAVRRRRPLPRPQHAAAQLFLARRDRARRGHPRPGLGDLRQRSAHRASSTSSPRSPTGDPSGPFRFTGGGWSAGYGSAANSYSTYDWAQGAGGGFDFIGGFSARGGGNYQTPLGAAPNSDYQSLGGNFKLGYTPTLGQRFELTLRDYSEVDGRAGGVGGAPGSPYLIARQDPNNVRTARLAYSGELDGLVKHVEGSIYADYYDTTLTTTNNTINAAGITTKTVTSNSHVIGPLMLGGRLQGDIPLVGAFGESKTTFGLDSFHEARPGSEQFSQTVNSNSSGVVTSIVNAPLTKTGPDTTQFNIGTFALHEWTPVRPLTLSLGGRYDWFNTGTDLSPLPATVLPPSSASKASMPERRREAPAWCIVFCQWSTCSARSPPPFRYPTNSELYSATATTIPNPNLQPERGVTYEGGARFHVAEAELKVTAFDTQYENFLQTVGGDVQRRGRVHAGAERRQAEVSGVELEARWQVTHTVNLFTNFAQLRGTNTVTNTPLAVPGALPWTRRRPVCRRGRRLFHPRRG